jgi:UDP-N-acetylmuramate dehydrogenase
VTAFDEALRALFGDARVARQVPLGPLTTFGVGGPADWLVETRSSDELVAALRLAHEAGEAVTLLGGGSNVLVSDAGVRGLVIRPRGGEVRRIGDDSVRADAAVTMNGLVRWSIVHGAAGLEAWAGTPGTVGGAVYGNAHFGGRLIGDLVVDASVAALDGTVRVLSAAQMEFGYDASRLQRTREVLLWAAFRIAAGDPVALRATARQSLAYRKSTQPLHLPSAGCIFRNPEPGRDRLPADVPWSAGALVDLSGLKAAAVGGARVSPTHANFIVNDGSATAADIRALIEQCRTAVLERFGVELREEIVYLGSFGGEHQTPRT